ncbi:MAG: arginine--tRNA ligase [Burkholderiaceae bacterium]
MLVSQRQTLARLLFDVVSDMAKSRSVSLPICLEDVDNSLQRPKQADHGDMATGLVMRLAKPFGSSPPALAQELATAICQADQQTLLASAEVAGPGFINFRLTQSARTAVVAEVLRDPGVFGRKPTQPDLSALLEFVSANPTGPLHVGHGRQAALGDALANLLASQGWRVHREFYYNDAGAQIQNLALSVQARVRGLGPEDPSFPADGYRGQYIEDIAQAYLRQETVRADDGEPVAAKGDPDDLEAIRQFAVMSLRHEQDLDLRAFGVKFDQFSLESALYTQGHVQSVVDRLIANQSAYEQDGALWLRTTDYGDDKDRVMRKTDGGYTYFVPDVAYHEQKFSRGFHKAINIQGSDHHGTIARVRAGLQALDIGIPKGFPDYVLHKMVTVMRAGQEVKISKRAGSYVTLRDLIQWSGEVRDEAGQTQGVDEQRGRDAVRFFLISRKADSEFVFDIDLALSRSDENPVYYIQYAHARICSVLSQAGMTMAQAMTWAQSLNEQDLAQRLSTLTERPAGDLMARLSDYPALLAQLAQDLAPHGLAYYLRDLAADLHGFYNAQRILVDEPLIREARLLLLLATAGVMRSGLNILGVSSPERM